MNTLKTMMYDWKTLDWRKLEQTVFKLQKRIYRAACRDDVKAVHKLQRLLIKSKAAAFLAVRRVTQINRGKKTAGVDGLSSLSKKQRLKLAHRDKWECSASCPDDKTCLFCLLKNIFNFTVGDLS